MKTGERLEQYFQANGVIDADKQRAIFLSVCGPSMYQTIRNLVAPKKTNRVHSERADREGRESPQPFKICHSASFLLQYTSDEA